MVEFIDFATVGTNLVQYLFGSYAALAVFLTIIFLVVLLAVGLEFKYAVPLTLPIMGLFSIGGWLGNSSYIFNVVVLIVAFVYGFAIIQLFRG